MRDLRNISLSMMNYVHELGTGTNAVKLIAMQAGHKNADITLDYYLSKYKPDDSMNKQEKFIVEKKKFKHVRPAEDMLDLCRDVTPYRPAFHPYVAQPGCAHIIQGHQHLVSFLSSVLLELVTAPSLECVFALIFLRFAPHAPCRDPKLGPFSQVYVTFIGGRKDHTQVQGHMLRDQPLGQLA